MPDTPVPPAPSERYTTNRPAHPVIIRGAASMSRALSSIQWWEVAIAIAVVVFILVRR